MIKPHTMTALDEAANELRSIPHSQVLLVLGSTTTAIPDEESFVHFCAANKGKQITTNVYTDPATPQTIISVEWSIGLCNVHVQCSIPPPVTKETPDAV